MAPGSFLRSLCVQKLMLMVLLFPFAAALLYNIHAKQMNLLAALVNQCFGPQGAGLTEIKGALCLSRLPHVCFYYKYC